MFTKYFGLSDQALLRQAKKKQRLRNAKRMREHAEMAGKLRKMSIERSKTDIDQYWKRKAFSIFSV